jgi:hypothetical protein
MPSKILSFICHVPGTMPGAYPAVPAAAAPRATDRKPETKTVVGGHFAAIYENDRFVRFKYINNNATS